VSRVLITGASGFIGQHALAPLLAAGHEVHALSTRPRRQPADVTWHQANLLDQASVAALIRQVRAERLLHLAWFAEPGRFWRSVENVRWVEATLRLLRTFREQGGDRAVVAGTCAEYDWSEGGILDEATSPLMPTTLYGTSKHATQLVSTAYAREAGLELAWGRVFFLYGPGEQPKRMVPSLATALLAGREAPATSGTQVRDFMHVADVAAAFAMLLDSPVQGPVNIASGDGIEVRDLIELVANAAGRRDLVRLGALEQREGEPASIVAAVDRLRREVGFLPSMTLGDGIESTVAWWRSR